MKKLLYIFLSFLLVLGLLSACSIKSTEGTGPREATESEAQQEQVEEKNEEKSQEQEEDVPTISSVMLTEEEKQKAGEKVAVILYFANDQVTKLVLEKRFIDKSKVGEINALASEVLNELFKGPISGDLRETVPKDVPVPTVVVKDKTATVDFSKEFVKKHPGGSTGEIFTVYSIVNTLTEIEGIEQVQFTIDGKKKDEFKGHLEFAKPFKPDKSLIEDKKE